MVPDIAGRQCYGAQRRPGTDLYPPVPQSSRSSELGGFVDVAIEFRRIVKVAAWRRITIRARLRFVVVFAKFARKIELEFGRIKSGYAFSERMPVEIGIIRFER